MARRDDNPIEFRLEARSFSGRRPSPLKYVNTLIDALELQQPLPRGWDVRLHWRNPTSAASSGYWHDEHFDEAVETSRDGFNGIVLGQLYRMKSRIQNVQSRRRNRG